jgi:osmoprotectant transport system substrate-binding protein
MSKRTQGLRRLLAITLAFGLLVAACGDDDSDDAGGDSGGSGDAAIEQLDLSGVSATVGSKDFTENIVLGEILVQAYEAAGADVTNEINLGGTSVNRDALLAGEIDVYPEYNGTGWTVHLGNEEPSSDPDELTQVVREADLEENDIHWLGQSPFNDTYGFATGPDLTDQNGGPFDLQGMADYVDENPDTTVCMETEFPDRPDGLVLFEEATDFEIPQDQIEILDTGIIYNETAQGNCDFGEIFTTDGRIPALELSIVDDGGAFILYNVSVTMRDDLYQEAPEAFDEIANLILDPIDNDLMAELNSQVDVEGEDAATVAGNYLVDQGLISG